MALPAVFLYLLSFLQIGIYWVNHHYPVDEVETVGHGFCGRICCFFFASRYFRSLQSGLASRAFIVHRALYAAVSIFPGLGYMALCGQIRSKSSAPALASWGKQIASVVLYLGLQPL